MQVCSSILDPQVVRLLKGGAVGAIPTDTVYGLVCNPANQASVKRLYALKQRDHKPGTLIAGSLPQLIGLGLKARYLKAVEQYWPNPLSVIIPCGPELGYLDSGMGLAVRIPAAPAIQKLLQQTGPLLTTSANQPGKEPAKNVEEAGLYFGGEVDFYVDGGTLKNRQPSTLIKVIDDEIEVLREGAVKINKKTGKVIK